MSVQDILNRNNSRVVTRPCNTTVSEIVEILCAENIGVVMLTDDQNKLAGILSERDIIKALSQQGKQVLNTPASKLMICDVMSCPPEATVEDVLEIMSAYEIRHLPVLAEGEIVGLVSIRDVLDTQRIIFSESA